MKAYFLCLKWVIGIHSGYTIATLPSAHYIALNSKFDIHNSTFMVRNIINKNNSLSCQQVHNIFDMLRNFSWVIFCYKRISLLQQVIYHRCVFSLYNFPMTVIKYILRRENLKVSTVRSSSNIFLRFLIGWYSNWFLRSWNNCFQQLINRNDNTEINSILEVD